MLVLARKKGQSIVIAEKIKITVLEIKGDQVRLGIDAPQELSVYREEIYKQILSENIVATGIDVKAVEALQELLDNSKDNEGKEQTPGDH
ncbi:MAG: carbon storage regulator CsrA [Syntrophomonadaceae bacterium]|jgi:carbon storage regulator|nr:carbon storage regulator CsrA [Thermoanaerobacterales bacterium]NLN21666.1 carbon storage regulator CsrA [Syntrophomonadaceae bacterium]HAF16780.1 carbon storage regulator [Peptococcaceae bacterium]